MFTGFCLKIHKIEHFAIIHSRLKMLKSNALEIIRSFTTHEIAEFKDFLQSPFFNKKTTVNRLFAEIMNYSPDFTDIGLDPQKLWAKLYPGKAYNYGVMKNLIHDITKLAEQFVIQIEYRKNKVQEFSNLYKAITNRNLRNVFENKEKIFNKITSENFIKNIEIPIEEYFHLVTKMYENKTWNLHFYTLKVNSEIDRFSTEDNFIAGILVHLIIMNYTAITFSIDVKNKTNMNNPTSLLLNSISEAVINEVFLNIKSRSEIKYIILNCYYLMFKVTTNLTNPEYFFKLKDLFHKNYQYLPALTIRDIDVIMLNSLSFYPDSHFDKQKEYSEIYLFKYNNNLVIDKNKQINSLQFLPWAVLFLEENKPEDLKEFNQNYRKYLVDEHKESTLFVANSVYYFMLGDYNQALKLLSKTKFDIFPLKNFVKKFTLLINYELCDYESFLSNVDSLNHFLSYSEKELKIERATNIKRTKLLIKFLNKLFLIRESNNIEDLAILESEIQNIYIDFKKWYIRKITEIKKPLLKHK